MKRVTIRAAKEEDFDSVFLLLQQLGAAQEQDENILKTVFRHGVTYEVNVFLCAEMNETVVGFCHMIIIDSLYKKGRIGYVGELVVDKSFRGRGIGTDLLDIATNKAKERDCTRIELDAAFNEGEAHRFYERIGFYKTAYRYSKDLTSNYEDKVFRFSKELTDNP